MIWSLALDDFTGQYCNRGPYPLLSAINQELGVKKAPVLTLPSLNTVVTEPPLMIPQPTFPARSLSYVLIIGFQPLLTVSLGAVSILIFQFNNQLIHERSTN